MVLLEFPSAWLRALIVLRHCLQVGDPEKASANVVFNLPAGNSSSGDWVETFIQSGRALPHSKTLRNDEVLSNARQRMECARLLALSNREVSTTQY